MNPHTHYEVLGLRETATVEEIKRRYHELVRRFHPDVAGTGNPARFRAIQEAYNVLTDPEARKTYDAALARSAGSATSTATAAPPPPPPGPPPQTEDVIAGKYRIVREIARSNDVVYEALDLTMGRRLAVKELVLPGNLTGTARRERIERFNREARAAGRLSHPNIVTVYDFGEDNGRYFIAMEYLDGGTLRDRIQGGVALPPDEAVGIADQVLRALAHAHSHNVVHRDVKPDNIHILPDGQVKLTDFGIARLTEEASLTGDGQVFGTPSYMSPEQIEGRAIDLRSDLFSLGVVLYEMLSGRKPFIGDSVVSITYAIMHAEPPPLTGVSFAIEQVVMRALSKDPAMRFASAEEMRRALRTADATPAIFLTSSMNAPAGPFGPPAPPAFAGGPPAAFNGAYGLNQVPPMGAPLTAPQAPPTPAPQAGPFVTWPQPAAAQPPPVPSRYTHRRSGGLSEGARTFLSVLLASLALSGVVVGFVLLFVYAYSQYQAQASQQRLIATLNAGTRSFQNGDLDGAAVAFRDVLARDPNGPNGRVARTNLAITLNRMGARAYERGDLQGAATAFEEVQDLYKNPNDIVSDRDREAFDTACQNLQTTRDRANAAGGSEGVEPGLGITTPPGDDSLVTRIANAQALLDEGLRAYYRNDLATAREKWARAVEAAPGTPPALQAQQFLDRLGSAPAE